MTKITISALIKSDIEKVWDVWKDVGGSTLSYDKIGYRLIRFISESTDTMIEIIKSKSNK